MKRKLIVLLVIILPVLCVACAPQNKDTQNTIESTLTSDKTNDDVTTNDSNHSLEKFSITEAVATIYENDFNYIKVIITQDIIDNSTSKITMLGEYTYSPYQEHIVIDYLNSDQKTSLWSEAIYSENENVVNVKLLTDEGWIEQKNLQRPYYYGFNEDVIFNFLEESTLDHNDVWK